MLAGYAWPVYSLSACSHSKSGTDGSDTHTRTHYHMACSHGYIYSYYRVWVSEGDNAGCLHAKTKGLNRPSLLACSQPYRVTIQLFQGFQFHTPIAHCTHVILVLELMRLSGANCHWNSCEVPQSDSKILSYLLPWFCIPQIQPHQEHTIIHIYNRQFLGSQA